MHEVYVVHVVHEVHGGQFAGLAAERVSVSELLWSKLLWSERAALS